MAIIVIDPGHGGRDTGAIGGGLLEKDLALNLGRLVAGRLAAYEVEVALTRTADLYVGLTNRSNLANDIKADYFCSIHINSGGGSGFESYAHTKATAKSAGLRDVIHDRVAGYYKSAGFPDRGKKRANFAILRETAMPAVLLENLFIDNPKDAARLKDKSFMDGLAAAIAGALAEALGLPLKSAQPVEQPAKTPVKVASQARPAQARAFLTARNPLAPDYVDTYVQMGEFYGIRWDAVFAQSCKETAFWKFGGLVRPEQNNFAGLGSFDGKSGASFATPQEGIEAQVQHWHVYYHGGDLPAGAKVVDPRRDAVIKSGWAGSLTYIEDLSSRWASDVNYGSSIVSDYLKPMTSVTVDEPLPTNSLTPEPTQPSAPLWDPAAEITKLKADGLIKNDHRPEEPVTWGEFATVINRLRSK